jgi:hypothetical protein
MGWVEQGWSAGDVAGMEIFVPEHAAASATTLRVLEGCEPQGAMSGNRKLLNCFFWDCCNSARGGRGSCAVSSGSVRGLFS